MRPGKRGLGAGRFGFRELLENFRIVLDAEKRKNNCWRLINSMIDRNCRIVCEKICRIRIFVLSLHTQKR